MNKRLLALMLIMLLLVAPAAFAELERGDRGYEVAELQQLLFETGWLFELPDGIFGRNTEEAVKGFEAYADLPVDGIADEVMIYELAVSLEALNEGTGIVSDYFGEYPTLYIGNAYGYYGNDDGNEYGGGTELAECCIQWTEADGSSHTDYCEMHHSIHMESYQMLESGDLESARYASGMWYAEVNALYDQWAELLTEEEQGGIFANRATFLASVEAQRMAANFGKQTDASKIKTEVGICQNLRNQAAWICSMIWQQKNGGLVSEQEGVSAPVKLNASVIIDGDVIYYSGNIAGVGEGVYAMNTDGSGLRRISDISAVLKAVSNGNLLVWHYDDSGYGAMEVLRTDGTLETVSYSNSYAMADNGRFYFGGSSVAEDGSDHQWLISSDPEFHDNYCPIIVVDGYLYYLDNNAVSGMAMYMEGTSLPGGSVISRVDLDTGFIDPVTSVGTRYLGVEDGLLYYVLENCRVYDEDGGMFVIEVDEGVYRMDLEELEKTRICGLADSDLVFDTYNAVKDGVIYGDRFDYESTPDGACSIIRVNSNGEVMQPIMLDDGKMITSMCIGNGVCYGAGLVGYEVGDNYYSVDVITAVDVHTGEITEIELSGEESMFYTEMPPQMTVIDGSVYFYVQDKNDGAESLKVLNMDDGSVRTLVKSAPLY